MKKERHFANGWRTREELPHRIGFCKTVRWYRRKLLWGEADWPSSQMEACPAFKAETAPKRAKLLKDLGGLAVNYAPRGLIKNIPATSGNPGIKGPAQG